MVFATRRLSVLIIAAFCLAPAGSMARQPSGIHTPQAHSDESALRALIDRFVTLLANKDASGLAALWSASETQRETYIKMLQAIFANTDKIEVKGLHVGKLVVTGDRAFARLDYETNAIDRTQNPSASLSLVRRALDFVREAGTWKISGERSAQEDLARSLLSAKSEGEIATILSSDADLLGPDLARALTAEGNRLLSEGDYPRSRGAYNLASRIAEQLGDQAENANALRGIGVTFAHEGDANRALPYYEKTLAIRQALGDQAKIAPALNGLGTIYLLLSDYEKALGCFYKSIAINETLGNKAGIATTLGNIGLLRFDEGNFAQALEYYQKSLTIREPLGDKFGTAAMLNNIGNAHRAVGNLDLALEYLTKSMSLRQEAGIPQTSEVLANIGRVHAQKGDLGLAREFFDKSLSVSEKLGEKDNIALALSEIGSIYLASGEYGLALDYLQKSLALSQTTSDRPAQSATLARIALVHRLERDYRRALEFSERGAAIARESGLRDPLWEASTISGRAHRDLRQTEQARLAFQEAIATIESLREDVPADEQDQQRFFEDKLAPYHDMVSLLVTENKWADGFSYAEQAKARVLLDILRGHGPGIFRAMTPQEREQERILNARLVAANSQITHEASDPRPDADRLSELKATLEKARLDRERFQSGLYAAHPELRIKRGRAKPVGIREAFELVPDSATVLLEYVVTDERTYLFTLGRRNRERSGEPDFNVYELPLQRKTVGQMAESFRKAVASRDLNFRVAAQKLYDLLVKPAAAQLKDKSTLVIVPDAGLWQLPFQALLSAANRYLIEDYAIFYAPSLTVLREMVKPRTIRTDTATLLAIGNTALGKETVQRARFLNRDEAPDPLPEAEREAKTLGELYAPHSTVYVGADARERQIKAEAGKYDILHLATHGILNDASPMYSHLILSQADQGQDEDGLLEAWEIMNLDLKARLAVLSACETARGQITAGEGVIGLSWALFVAGCPTTVVSQWKMDSRATAKLMIDFHRDLKPRVDNRSGKMGVARSLREAALKLLGTKEYRHPFYWAGFIVVGNGY